VTINQLQDIIENLNNSVLNLEKKVEIYKEQPKFVDEVIQLGLTIDYGNPEDTAEKLKKWQSEAAVLVPGKLEVVVKEDITPSFKSEIISSEVVHSPSFMPEIPISEVGHSRNLPPHEPGIPTFSDD
jgi:hypothetical protein